MFSFQYAEQRLAEFFHHPVRYSLLGVSVVVMVGWGGNCNAASNIPSQATFLENNTLPLANAGVNQTVKEGALVTLDGRASKDFDGHIVSYRWVQEKHPLGIGVILSGADTATPTLYCSDISGAFIN